MTTQIGNVIASGPRWATVARSTKETDITVTLRLDGTGKTTVETGVGFFDHLLSAMAHHALFDLEVKATGDLVVDEHHTVEDVALVTGAAFAQCLGDRSGIVRFGDAAVPMDESVATAVVDVGGRPYSVVRLPFRGTTAPCRQLVKQRVRQISSRTIWMVFQEQPQAVLSKLIFR